MNKKEFRSLVSLYYDEACRVSKINLLKIFEIIDSNYHANCQQLLCREKIVRPAPTDTPLTEIGAGLMIFCIKTTLCPVMACCCGAASGDNAIGCFSNAQAKGGKRFITINEYFVDKISGLPSL